MEFVSSAIPELKQISNLLGKRSNLHALQCFRFDASLEEGLKVTASDLEVGMTLKLFAQVLEGGALVVPASIADLLATADTVNLNTKGSTLHIKKNGFKGSLKGLPAEEYPQIPTPDRLSASFQITVNALEQLLGPAPFAATTDTGRAINGLYLTWRPDGEKISYVVDDFEKAEIWVMDSDGSGAERLVADVAPVTSHSWSPDGTQIVFVSGGQDICILDLAGRTVTNLTGERLGGGHPSDARDPDWSPDGLRIAFSASDGRNQDIYLINVDGTGLTRLTSHEARDKHPDWSPDGMAIVFSSTRSSQRYPDLFALDLTLGTEEEGNAPLQLTAEDKLKERPDWSHDGAWIMFLSNELGAGHGTIYAVSADGRFLVQITADNVYHSPRWRP